MNTWQPIETAPRDGGKFIGAVIYNGFILCCNLTYDCGVCFQSFDYSEGTAKEFNPTHWVPLPEVEE